MNKQAEHGEGHVIPVRIYLATYVALLALLVATWGVAQFSFGPFNNIIALAIAVVKAVLVVLFFMGVRYGSRLTWVWAAAGFIWLILLFGTLGDYISRGWVSVKGW